MANKMENLDLEIAHFRNFRQHVPGMEKCCQETVEKLLELGVIEVSTAFEQALGKLGDHEVVSQNCGDLYRDGKYSDAKLSSVRTSGYGKKYSAQVSAIHGKTGTLRVQVYERKKNQFYYFAFPRNTYIDIPKSSNIEIPFELDGTPRRKPLRKVYVNWWKYEVDTLNLMANKY
jgi:hypothetical protein